MKSVSVILRAVNNSLNKFEVLLDNKSYIALFDNKNKKIENIYPLVDFVPILDLSIAEHIEATSVPANEFFFISDIVSKFVEFNNEGI